MRVSLDQRLDIREGREVEVCYDYQEIGFKSVWYKAIIEAKPPTRLKSAFTKLSLRLLKDDSLTLLTQLPQNVFLRPLPPRHLQARITIKQGCVVDAYHDDGWWTGSVVKEMEDNKTCLVFFRSPPDIILFERKDLRPHLKWVDKKWWVVPRLQRLTEESMFSSGTMVEVSSKTDNMETVWVPAMIIIEDDDKNYLVKFCNKPLRCEDNKERPNVTVDSHSVRPTPPPFVVEDYKLLDSVEAFRGSKWTKGIVKRVAVSQKWYMVSFEDTKKQLKFNHSDLRPPMDWEDGVWKTRDSPLAQGSGNKLGGSVMNGDTPSPSNESVSPVISSPVITSTQLKHTEAETQGKTFPKKTFQPMRNQNGLENESTRDKVELILCFNMSKGCEIEVCSEEEGFEDAWYRAILQDNPSKSGRKKLRVRYLTLLDEDGVSPLSENVAPRFIRPVPPETLYEGVVLEEGSMVDADHKDGWWTGLVIKILEDDKFLVYYDSPPDLFHFPRKQLRPHFDWISSNWLRPQTKELSNSLFSCGTMVEMSCKFDGSEALWVPALVVKEIEEDGQNKLIVKCCDKSLRCDGDELKPNITVDKCTVRPIPPPFCVEKYELLDRVEAFHGSGWRQGRVRGVLSDKNYSVSFVATKEELVFKHSDLRPSEEWEDGVWRQGTKRKPEKVTPSDRKRKMSVDLDTTLSDSNSLCRPGKLKIIHSSTAAKTITPASLSAGGNAAVTCKKTTKHIKTPLNSAEIIEIDIETDTEVCETVARMESPIAQESGAQMADDVRNSDAMPVITSQVRPIGESAPPVISIINTTQLKEPEAETQGMASPERTLQPMRMQNGLGIDSTGEKMSKEHNGEDNTRKRNREQKHDSNLNEAGEACNGSKAQITDTRNDICDDVYDQPLSAWTNLPAELSFDHHSPTVVNNAATSTDVEETQGKDTLSILPFAKKSPYWKTYETQEVCKTVPQSPHFSPLLEAKEDFREWTAVGMMVTFYGLLEEVKNLQLDDSTSKLSSLSSSFAELEKHGFDVATPQSRINKIMSLQDGRAKKEEERKCLEKKIEAEEIEKHKLEEEMVELECKILELKRQKAVAGEKKEAADKSTMEMKSCAETIDQEIEDLKLEFQTAASAPW